METAKRFRKRDAILEAVRRARSHPSADMVYASLQKTHPDISLATVYRNLALFKRRGDIISVGTVDGVERFDGHTEPHVHFICRRCGAVRDLPQLTVPQEMTRLAADQTAGQVELCQLTFTGVCSSCCAEAHHETNH